MLRGTEAVNFTSSAFSPLARLSDQRSTLSLGIKPSVGHRRPVLIQTT